MNNTIEQQIQELIKSTEDIKNEFEFTFSIPQEAINTKISFDAHLNRYLDTLINKLFDNSQNLSEEDKFNILNQLIDELIEKRKIEKELIYAYNLTLFISYYLIHQEIINNKLDFNESDIFGIATICLNVDIKKMIKDLEIPKFPSLQQDLLEEQNKVFEKIVEKKADIVSPLFILNKIFEEEENIEIDYKNNPLLENLMLKPISIDSFINFI